MQCYAFATTRATRPEMFFLRSAHAIVLRRPYRPMGWWGVRDPGRRCALPWAVTRRPYRPEKCAGPVGQDNRFLTGAALICFFIRGSEAPCLSASGFQGPSKLTICSVTGISLPERAKACLRIIDVPPQQGTSIRSNVIERIACREKIAASFSIYISAT